MQAAGEAKHTRNREAVVLLSGGLDSAVTLAYAKREGYACYALTIDYKQRHAVEIKCACKIAEAFGVQEHKIIQVDLRAFGGSSLTDNIPVPKAGNSGSQADKIPATYVPARNTIFLSLGLAWAEVLQAEAIFIGANSVDYSGYPDCRPEYLNAYQHLANLATKAGSTQNWGVKIEAPLLHFSKADIIRLGKKLSLDFAMTSSCYNPQADGKPCRECESCLIRQRGFAEAKEIDPIVS